jgi:hypothetical protein
MSCAGLLHTCCCLLLLVSLDALSYVHRFMDSQTTARLLQAMGLHLVDDRVADELDDDIVNAVGIVSLTTPTLLQLLRVAYTVPEAEGGRAPPLAWLDWILRQLLKPGHSGSAVKQLSSIPFLRLTGGDTHIGVSVDHPVYFVPESRLQDGGMIEELARIIGVRVMPLLHGDVAARLKSLEIPGLMSIDSVSSARKCRQWLDMTGLSPEQYTALLCLHVLQRYWLRSSAPPLTSHCHFVLQSGAVVQSLTGVHLWPGCPGDPVLRCLDLDVPCVSYAYVELASRVARATSRCTAIRVAARPGEGSVASSRLSDETAWQQLFEAHGAVSGLFLPPSATTVEWPVTVYIDEALADGSAPRRIRVLPDRAAGASSLPPLAAEVVDAVHEGCHRVLMDSDTIAGPTVAATVSVTFIPAQELDDVLRMISASPPSLESLELSAYLLSPAAVIKQLQGHAETIVRLSLRRTQPTTGPRPSWTPGDGSSASDSSCVTTWDVRLPCVGQLLMQHVQWIPSPLVLQASVNGITLTAPSQCLFCSEDAKAILGRFSPG